MTGGFDLGFERAGMECAWQVEIDDYCTRVLQKHWPDVPKYKDVRDVGKHNLKAVDVICGGFPCQDVSLAGKRAGLKGKRSTLWSEFYRIICEVRPEWIVIENVPGLYSSDNGRFFRKILWELSKGRYDVWWDIIPAAAFGSIHIRERVFLVGRAHNTNSISYKTFSEIFIKITRSKPNAYTKRNNKRSWWGKKPGVPRVAYGIPSELDKNRLRSLGNAVVPQVAEWIAERIMEVHFGNFANREEQPE